MMIVAPMILDRPTDMNETIELVNLRAVKGIRLLVMTGNNLRSRHTNYLRL